MTVRLIKPRCADMMTLLHFIIVYWIDEQDVPRAHEETSGGMVCPMCCSADIATPSPQCAVPAHENEPQLEPASRLPMSGNDEVQSEYMVSRDLDATHERRVRLLAVVASAAMTLVGLGIFVAFAVGGRWVNCAFECPILVIGATGAMLTQKGNMRGAALLMIFGLFAFVCAIALFGDVPTPRIPRTTHLFLFPLAFASHIGMKREKPWLRHGFSILCMSAIILFATTNYVIDVGLFLPDGTHAMVNWIISITAIGALYVFLHIYMGDVGRMESYLHLANNRFVSLVSGMFPRVIAERLLTNRQTFAERYANCSVLFADIVGFTGMTERMSPEAMIAMLSEIFLRFDQCVEKNGLTKIKTIGDAYMAAAGAPEPNPDHAKNTIEFAVQMLEVIKNFPDVDLRIGIASGELVAGVIGQSRQVYDVWGDVVNLASRIESLGSANQIQVSETTYTLVKHLFNFEVRSGLTIKGKAGKHNVYLLSSCVAAADLTTS